MKRNIAILISFMMVLTFALAACGGGGSSDDVSGSKYVGTWKADTASFAGESESFDDMIVLTLNDDGTGTMTGLNEEGGEEVSDFTWTLTDGGFKTSGDVKLKFKDDGDGIVANIIGVDLHFTRAGEEGEEVVDFIDGAAYGYRSRPQNRSSL